MTEQLQCGTKRLSTLILGGTYRRATDAAAKAGLGQDQWEWVHDAHSARGLDGARDLIDLGPAHRRDTGYHEAVETLAVYRGIGALVTTAPVR